MINIVGKRRWFFLISSLLILPGVISLIIPPALKPGIEFTSGTALNITFTEPLSKAGITEDDIRQVLDDLGHTEALIQKTGQRSVFIRTNVLEEEERAQDGTLIRASEQTLIEERLGDRAPIESREVDTVSAIVARETVRIAIIAVVVASLFILIYITWAFRSIPNSFRYGVSAILAIVHDMLLIIGIFSILGKAINLEVNFMFVVGLLTVLGYSVNDTIVVFDRIRENVSRNVERPLAGLVNNSIMESMGRSLNTSFTTLFVLLALLLIGGPTIRGFLMVLAIGVVVGTYSSIFIASQFLVDWEQGELRKVLVFLRLARARSA